VLTVSPLVQHKDLLPLLSSWLVQEWPDWYGPGGRGDAGADLSSFAASEASLPVGFAALLDGVPIGVAALKTASLPTHGHLTPWAGAGLVLPAYRGRGVGAKLLDALVQHAARLGFLRIYCATATAVSLLRRSGWSEVESIQHEGQSLAIFCKDTAAQAFAHRRGVGLRRR